MINKLKSYLLLYFSKQFIYFVIAGASAATINFSSRLILRNYLDIIVSALLANIIAMIIAFFLYRKLVFPFSSIPFETQGIRFVIIQVSFMPVAIYIFSILANLFYIVGLEDYAEPTAHIISIGAPALITFLLYKFFVFYK
jgi:putative flippase GtrA